MVTPETSQSHYLPPSVYCTEYCAVHSSVPTYSTYESTQHFTRSKMCDYNFATTAKIYAFASNLSKLYPGLQLAGKFFLDTLVTPFSHIFVWSLTRVSVL
jgi:hypothetical protein